MPRVLGDDEVIRRCIIKLLHLPRAPFPAAPRRWFELHLQQINSSYSIPHEIEYAKVSAVESEGSLVKNELEKQVE